MTPENVLPLSTASVSSAAHPARVPSPDDTAAGGLAIATHFQPIASIRRGEVLGVEALTRAWAADGAPVAPLQLFAGAARDGSASALDRLCRARALSAFTPLHRANPTLVCFVNCHVRTFLSDVEGAHAWSDLAAGAGIDPRAIALEVLESEAADLDALAEATARYRAAGFLVVIDDVGAGHSNLDRVAAIRPDLLKADRSLVHGCAHDRVKRAVLRALVSLTEELGGWLVVEGIEDEHDALTALDLGADLLQGYHLARPAAMPSTDGLTEPTRRAVELALRFRDTTRERVLGARTARARRLAFARAAAVELEGCGPETWATRLKRALGHAPGESGAATATVLDAGGRQLIPVLRSPTADVPERTLIFHIPEVGADHALKEYVYLLAAEADATFESAPYVPMPNEKLCVTISTAFRDDTGERRLLCLHLDAQLDEHHLDGGPPADSLGR